MIRALFYCDLHSQHGPKFLNITDSKKVLVFEINHMKIDSQYYLQITSSYLNIRPLQRIQIWLICSLSSLSIAFHNQRFYFWASRDPLSLVFAAPWWKVHTDSPLTSRGEWATQGSRAGLVFQEDTWSLWISERPHTSSYRDISYTSGHTVPCSVKPVGAQSDGWRARGSRVR